MWFTRNEIKSKIIWIIDIWTYKIRAWICEIKNWELKLIWYWEKRQNLINASSITTKQDIKSLCSNIKLAIKKAEEKADNEVWELILNISFKEIFFNFNTFNYKRKVNKKEDINKKELDEIISELEKNCFDLSVKKINYKSLYNKNDVQLIASNINKIKIDRKEIKKLIWEKGENINASILNIFITKESYDLVQFIWEIIDKKILKILPTELSITKLFPNTDNVVILDIWSNHLSIIVKKYSNIIWVSKIDIWINSLIKDIQKKHKKTKIEIINSIDENHYKEEKNCFLDIFKDCLITGLDDILIDNICPNDFFILWWWNNSFIKEFIKELDFNKENIKLLKNINFIKPEIKYFDDITTKSNINLISMMLSTLDYIKNEKDPINQSLEKAIKEIEEKN